MFPFVPAFNSFDLDELGLILSYDLLNNVLIHYLPSSGKRNMN